MREEEEKVRSGLEKLVSTGKRLIDCENVGPSERSGDQPPLSAPTGNFSSHDLIREKVADPSSFDGEDQPENNDNELIVVSPENAPSRIDNVNRWSLNSLNPFAYLQRPQDDENGGNGAANDDTGEVEVDVEEPQLASTPKDIEGAGD